MTEQVRGEPFDRRAYAEFIGQIDLRRIWVSASRVQTFHGPTPPDETNIVVDDQARWETHPDGFRALHSYSVRARDRDETLYAEIDVTFAVDYASAQPMTDELFEAFGRVNLPVNTWPFLREFVSTTIGRMGWLPITLPALKVGTLPTRSSPPTADEQPTPKPKRARKKASAPRAAATADV